MLGEGMDTLDEEGAVFCIWAGLPSISALFGVDFIVVMCWSVWKEVFYDERVAKKVERKKK